MVDMPKNPGDRAFGHGDKVTVELAGEDAVEGGDWLAVDPEGTPGEGELVVEPADLVEGEPSEIYCVAKYNAEPGETLTANFRGMVRAVEDPEAPYDAVRSYDGGDTALYILR